MKLFGSTTSPYARRIQVYCLENNINLECVFLDIFDPQDRNTLITLNPTRKIPMLEDEHHIIFDSGVIQHYLAVKYSLPTLNWAQLNQLSMINSCNDSFVELLLCQRSGLDIHDDILFFNLQHERTIATLHVLEEHVANNQFNTFDYPAISLYCLLDWICFRKLYDLTQFEHLSKFWQRYQTHAHVINNDPRQ